MTYLEPPPNPSPVVVVKDVGGYVDQYAARTALYRAQNREVRLHECRSACTMALSLPNVCVYPDSLLKFHQAYDPRDRSVNYAVSQQLFETYPPAVRARLGTLTRQYQVLRGAELIALGVRDCNTPAGPRIMVAQASLKPLPDSMTSGVSGLSVLTGKIEGMVSSMASPLAPTPGGEVSKPAGEALKTTGEPPKPQDPGDMLRAKLPLPPDRTGSMPLAPEAPSSTTEPVPPKRPLVLVAYTPSLKPIPFMQRIEGSAPILAAKFVPFPKKS